MGIPFHPPNGNSKKVRGAILRKIHVKALKRDREGYCVMIKGSIQEDTTTVNIYASNIEALKYIKQILTDIKGKIDSKSLVVGDFNTLFTLMERPSIQKSKKGNTDLIDIFRNSIPKKQNTYCFRVYVELSPGWMTCQAT